MINEASYALVRSVPVPGHVSSVPGSNLTPSAFLVKKLNVFSLKFVADIGPVASDPDGVGQTPCAVAREGVSPMCNGISSGSCRLYGRKNRVV